VGATETFRAGDAPVAGDVDLAAVGALVADESRCRMLLALDDGRALPATRLAAEAGVSAATASTHLRRLTDAGLLAVTTAGRHRYYRLAGPDVAQLIEVLGRLAPHQPVRSLRQGTRAQALRRARTCYDHLAGRLGVAIMAALLARGHLTGGDGYHDAGGADGPVGFGHEVEYTITPAGHEFLADLAVPLPAHRRAVRYCVDWTEQRHHVAGGLGRGLRDRFAELGWIVPGQRSRAVGVTDDGRAGFADLLGITLDG
jgi:DNA-binding transcriptional ArsR family regulator